jgi:hypothetical protein
MWGDTPTAAVNVGGTVTPGDDNFVFNFGQDGTADIIWDYNAFEDIVENGETVWARSRATGSERGHTPRRSGTERKQRAGQAAEEVGFGTCRGERKANAARERCPRRRGTVGSSWSGRRGSHPPARRPGVVMVLRRVNSRRSFHQGWHLLARRDFAMTRRARDLGYRRLVPPPLQR